MAPHAPCPIPGNWDMHNRWLYRYCILLSACTFFLLIAGAAVTSNGAGLSVPDWPLSFGTWMPEMKGGVFYEHGHRMVATLVGLLTIGFAVWFWKEESRPAVRWLGPAAVLLVVLQGVLGGVTVLYKLPKPVSILHACLAQLYFSLAVAAALLTSRAGRGPAPRLVDSGRPSLRLLAGSLPVAVLGQTALGAAYRHEALGVMPHVLGALALSILIFVAVQAVLNQCGGRRELAVPAKAVMHCTVLQVLLGVLAYLARMVAEGPAGPFQVYSGVAHVAAGALVMAASVVLAIQVFRRLSAAESAREPKLHAGVY